MTATTTIFASSSARSGESRGIGRAPRGQRNVDGAGEDERRDDEMRIRTPGPGAQSLLFRIPPVIGNAHGQSNQHGM
jgi:hypothetical protein